MAQKRHIPLIMTMISTLIIVLHGIVPHHHADTIELCGGSHSTEHVHSLAHISHDACNTNCRHLDEKDCTDESHLCSQFFAFVNSLSSESSEHFLLFFVLGHGADQLAQPCELPTSALCHHHQCACIDDGVFSNLIARRGPPVVC